MSHSAYKAGRADSWHGIVVLVGRDMDWFSFLEIPNWPNTEYQRTFGMTKANVQSLLNSGWWTTAPGVDTSLFVDGGL